MGVEADVGGLLPARRVDHRQRAGAVAHQHAAALRVDPHIVGVAAELDARDRRQILARQYPHRAIAGIRNIDAVGKRDVGDTLRLAEPGERAQHFAGLKVDHPQAVVAELGDEEAPTLQIDAEVVDPPADLAERDLRLQHQWRGDRLRPARRRQYRHRQQQGRVREYAPDENEKTTSTHDPRSSHGDRRSAWTVGRLTGCLLDPGARSYAFPRSPTIPC